MSCLITISDEDLFGRLRRYERGGGQDNGYGPNALFNPCMQTVKLKLFCAVRRRWTAMSPDNLRRTFQRMADAHRLLRELDPPPSRGIQVRDLREKYRKRRISCIGFWRNNASSS
jgi:hypothetical protein